jgi:hypothetical protein
MFVSVRVSFFFGVDEESLIMIYDLIFYSCIDFLGGGLRRLE